MSDCVLTDEALQSKAAVDPTVLRRSWLDVMIHVYSRAAHGRIWSQHGWMLFGHGDNEQHVLIAEDPLEHCSPYVLPRIIRQLPDATNIVIEFLQPRPDLFDYVRTLRYAPSYDLPVHVFSTDLNWLRERCRAGAPKNTDGWNVVEVQDQKTLEDFACVQAVAYQATYGWPLHLQSRFYDRLSSCAGPDVVSVVVYDPNGRPVRTGQIVRARGLVHGIAGAVIPEMQGRHLGHLVYEYLGRVARERFGAEVVYHETMPCARPIAKRLKLPQVALWSRWEELTFEY